MVGIEGGVVSGDHAIINNSAKPLALPSEAEVAVDLLAEVVFRIADRVPRSGNADLLGRKLVLQCAGGVGELDVDHSGAR